MNKTIEIPFLLICQLAFFYNAFWKNNRSILSLVFIVLEFFFICSYSLKLFSMKTFTIILKPCLCLSVCLRVCVFILSVHTTIRKNQAMKRHNPNILPRMANLYRCIYLISYIHMLFNQFEIMLKFN